MDEPEFRKQLTKDFFWPRLCENVFEFDDAGTAHHIGN
jgi:hypothetical protein